MWPALTILASAGILALHFWWKRRYDQVREKLHAQAGQNASLHEQQQVALA